MKSIRLVIASRAILYAEALAALLEDRTTREFAPVGIASSREELLHLCARTSPDAVIVDESITTFSRSGEADILAMLQASHTGITLVIIRQVGARHALHTGSLGAAIEVDPSVSGDALKSSIRDAVTCKSSGRNRRPAGNAPAITAREQQVLDLLTDGLSNKEIANRLGIQTHTVKNHVSRLLEKLNMEDRVQLAIFNVDARRQSNQSFS